MTQAPLRQNVSLRPYNTFGVEAKASYLLEITDEEVLHTLRSSPLLQEQRRLILGSGSNLLFTRDYEGLILLNRLKGIEIPEEDDNQVTVRAASGEIWDDLVRYAVDHGWHGAENLSLIPGTVGAAAVQNIGAYGAEADTLIQEVRGISLPDGREKIFSNRQCLFGYRDSIFKSFGPGTFFITSVTFRFTKAGSPNLSYPALAEELQKEPYPSPAMVREAVIRIRRSKLPDPAETGNAGSFFKNPVLTKEDLETIRKKYPDIPSHKTEAGHFKVPAAWLIEQCGWKGIRESDYGTWPRQPLVIVNYGNATGREIDTFAERIAASVKERFGISLVREVLTM